MSDQRLHDEREGERESVLDKRQLPAAAVATDTSENLLAAARLSALMFRRR